MDLSQTTLLPPLDAFVPGVLPLFVLRLCGAMNICFYLDVNSHRNCVRRT